MCKEIESADGSTEPPTYTLQVGCTMLLLITPTAQTPLTPLVLPYMPG